MPGTRSYNYLMAKPRLETWSLESLGRLILLTEMAGRFSIAF